MQFLFDRNSFIIKNIIRIVVVVVVVIMIIIIIVITSNLQLGLNK